MVESALRILEDCSREMSGIPVIDYPLIAGTVLGGLVLGNYLVSRLFSSKIVRHVYRQQNMYHKWRGLLHDLHIQRYATVGDYKKPPKESGFDEIASFAKLGLDLKITPDEEVRFIEVNGFNAGMKGFEGAAVKLDIKLGGLLSPFETVLATSSKACEEKLIRDLLSMGEHQFNYIYFGMLAQTLPKDANPEELLSKYPLVYAMLADKASIHPLWHERYGHLADLLMEIDQILGDKRRTDRLFDGNRTVKSPSYEYSGSGLSQLLDAQYPDYIVSKPINGLQGKGVNVVSTRDLIDSRIESDDNRILEAFVPSKPIKSKKTGQYHDGCMRYIVVVLQYKSGETKLCHYGGYWRLCPKPISEYGDVEAMRANLTIHPGNPNGALAERASRRDIRLVQQSVDKVIPDFYSRLVQMADQGLAKKTK